MVVPPPEGSAQYGPIVALGCDLSHGYDLRKGGCRHIAGSPWAELTASYCKARTMGRQCTRTALGMAPCHYRFWRFLPISVSTRAMTSLADLPSPLASFKMVVSDGCC